MSRYGPSIPQFRESFENFKATAAGSDTKIDTMQQTLNQIKIDIDQMKKDIAEIKTNVATNKTNIEELIKK